MRLPFGCAVTPPAPQFIDYEGGDMWLTLPFSLNSSLAEGFRPQSAVFSPLGGKFKEANNG